MRKRSCAWGDGAGSAAQPTAVLGWGCWMSAASAPHPPPAIRRGRPGRGPGYRGATARLLVTTVATAAAGCATPQYAIRPAPQPEESVSALQIEQAISAEQAREFARQGAQPLSPGGQPAGFPIQAVVDRLCRVTERPQLHYRVWWYEDQDPNAAALADGRIYVSSGMLAYLASRGSRQDELAFILGHELAHTVAQHLVKRYRYLQQQQLLMAVVGAGASALTRDASPGAQQAGRLALEATGLLRNVANSGYSQEQELEADQLGIRYVIRAGYQPQAALALLQDFERFDSPFPFLRTHPPTPERRAQLARYLAETGAAPAPRFGDSAARAPSIQPRGAKVRELRWLQATYPEGSVSWRNLEQQIRALEQ